MSPASLKSFYQQYKADTNVVATWLANTAKQYGFQHKTEAPTDGTVRINTQRAKHKARSKAKDVTKQKHILAIRDFLPMAQHIAKKESSVKVPDFFAVAIERVIWVRKTFASKLSEAGVNVSSDGGGHTFFVLVLERVRDSLKPVMEAGVFNMDELKKATADAASSAGGARDSFKNMFGILGVYEPSEAFLNAPDVVVTPTSTTDVQYVAEQSDDTAEVLFALTALISDYERLRSEIRSLWTEWAADGSLDLAPVAVATNTAFELARAMEDDIAPLLKKFGGRDQAMELYFRTMCRLSGVTPAYGAEERIIAAYDIAQTCLLETYVLLSSYAAANDLESVVTNYNGMFGWYDENLGGSATSNREKWQQDKTALMEILPDLQFMSSKFGTELSQDELVRGVYSLLDNGKPGDSVPLWLAWAARIYLDILQSLGPDCDKGYKEMKREIVRMKKLVLGVPPSYAGFGDMAALLCAWDEDPIKQVRDFSAKLGLLPASAAAESVPFRFLHRNPIYCGLWIHDLRATFHNFGLHYAAEPGTIMAVTQLYHALRQEKLLPDDVKWEDLETFREMQGNPAFFVGDPPTDFEGYHKNWMITIGTSITNWAPNRRGTKTAVNINNRPAMKNLGVVSIEMRNRLVPSADHRAPITKEFLEMIINSARRNAILTGKGKVRQDLKGKAKEAAAAAPVETSITPGETIRQLALLLQAEIPFIRFDYFAMHNICVEYLKLLKTKFSELAGQDFSRFLPPQEEHIRFLAGFCFVAATGNVTIKDKIPGNRELLYAAGEATKEFLEKGRGRVIKDEAGKVLSEVELDELGEEVGLAVRGLGVKDAWGIGKLMRQIKNDPRSKELPEGCPMQ